MRNPGVIVGGGIAALFAGAAVFDLYGGDVPLTEIGIGLAFAGVLVWAAVRSG